MDREVVEPTFETFKKHRLTIFFSKNEEKNY